MTITISTNISASIAQAAMTRNSRELDTAMEKLSTGKKINSAGDNASGLAITTRMTSQIRQLTQTISNAHNYISLISTADGAATEIEVMLQRMRELAVQSGTGTSSSKDRSYLNAEFIALRSEIDRIAKNTSWNGEDGLLASPCRAWHAGSNTDVLTVILNLGEHYSEAAFSVPFGNFTLDHNPTGFNAINYSNGKMPARPQLSGIASKTLSSLTATSAIALASGVIQEVDIIFSSLREQRGIYGATVNRVSNAIDNFTNSLVHLEASRSRILDTDYAAATSELAKRQILQQAGVAMIAQANALPQTVMMLLSD